MIRSTVRKHRIWTSILTISFGFALILMACETSMPQGGDITGVATGEVGLDLSTDQIEFPEWLFSALKAGEMTEKEARAMWAEKYVTAHTRSRPDSNAGVSLVAIPGDLIPQDRPMLVKLIPYSTKR